MLCARAAAAERRADRPLFTVGLVGYPNVGKSSTVNVLVAEKKTSVSATPGKTKHFQTLRVPDAPAIELCDCPGLVFPSVAGSKAQMVCDGILPIDQMRDYMSPVRLLCGRLGPDAFFDAYGVKLRSAAERADDADAPDEARELLIAHALSRGFMSSSKGGPDESRSARVILKDLVNARLLHCTPPPTADGAASQLAQPRLNPPTPAAPPAGGSARGAKARKAPRAPTAEAYLNQLRDDHARQDSVGLQAAGRPGSSSRGGARGVQWRGSAQAVPDRLVARGAGAGSYRLAAPPGDP